MECRPLSGSSECFFIKFGPFLDILWRFEKYVVFQETVSLHPANTEANLEFWNFGNNLNFYEWNSIWAIESVWNIIWPQEFMRRKALRLYKLPYILNMCLRSLEQFLRRYKLGTFFKKLWVYHNEFSKIWGMCRKWNMCKLTVSWKTPCFSNLHRISRNGPNSMKKHSEEALRGRHSKT